MAPNYPEELDVFTVPHSRMKQLVHKYLDMVTPANFRNPAYMGRVLEKLCHTFHVFKAHEQIENRFIMRRLKEKLIALDITDAAVCNCHSDNRLTEMLCMVLDGYRYVQTSEQERIKYGDKLRKALEDFTQDFIPHMKEEEEVFQPMLIEYFTYDELKELKVKVIQQHQQKVEEVKAEVEKFVPERDSAKAEAEVEEPSPSLTDKLPAEVMLKILSHLSPRDLARCAQVSKQWNQLALDPFLWPSLNPVQWAAGDWSFNPYVKDEDEVEETWQKEDGEDFYYQDDEDADRDESSDSDSSESHDNATLQQALREVRIINGLVKYVLPRVGSGVVGCHLGHSKGISSSLVHKILKLCPNIQMLNLSHTKITDAAFKEYGMKGGLGRLEHLDLSGCENITDNTLRCLSGENLPSIQKPSCKSRGKHPTPPALLRVGDYGEEERGGNGVDIIDGMREGRSMINQDPSLTDLELALCSLDCLDICLERCAPIDGGGGTAAENPFLRRTQREGDKNVSSNVEISSLDSDVGKNSSPSPRERAQDIVVSCCAVKRTNVTVSGEIKDLGTGCCGEVSGCGGELTFRGQGVDSDPHHPLHTLTHLNLNSCCLITNDGLRALSSRGGLPRLTYLDLSGCVSVTGEGVAELVETCQSLDHAHLFYCDNIFPDPYPSTASGCRNLECSSRICCRSGQ